MATLFIHLAKTGGLSLRRMMMSSPALSSFDCVHHHMLIEFRQGVLSKRRRLEDVLPMRASEYQTIFTFVRHPLERLASCHQYFLRGGLNQFHAGSSEQDLRWQQLLKAEAPSLDECCYKLKDLAEIIPHFKPMTTWLDALQLPEPSRLFVGHHETFRDDAKCLFKMLAPGHQFQELHVNRSATEKQPVPLSQEGISAARLYYKKDLERFSYID